MTEQRSSSGELKTKRTRAEWAALNPYFQGSMRSSAAPVFVEAKDDIEALFEEIERLRGAAQRQLDRGALATAILAAEVDHPRNLPGEKRSLGYYASVGIDHFSHPHDTLGKLALAAADVALSALPSTALCTPPESPHGR